MQVGPGRISGIPDLCNHIPGFDLLPGRNKDLGTVPVFGRQGMSFVCLAFNSDTQAITAGISRKGDRSVMPGKDLCALRHPDVHTGVIVLFPTDGMYPVAVITGHIREPVGAKDIFDILAVSFCLQQDLADLFLVCVHPGNDQVFQRYNREFDI